MKLKILLSGIIYTLIGALLLVQTNLVLAIASDPNNPITAAITSAISGDSNSNPESTSTPQPTQQPLSAPIINTNPTPTPQPIQEPISAPISIPIVNTSPTPTPQPTVAPTPTPQPVITATVIRIFPNPATLGTRIKITGTGFTNSSKVYISGALMSTNNYQVSTDGNNLSFILDSELTFKSGETHGLAVINDEQISNTVLLTIAASVIQTIPAISANQILVAPSVSLDTNRPQVVLASSNFNTTINIPLNVSNPTLSFSNLLTTSATQTSARFNNILNINSSTSVGNITVQIPALTNIVGPVNWDGVINAPKVLASTQVSPVADSGTNVTTQSVIEVGIGDTPLTFSKAVRLLIPNQAGKLVGYQRGNTFTKITQNCSADSQISGDNLSASGDCYINVGSDLVIWTKHFTKFATYTQSSNSASSSSSSNSSNSNTSASVCTDTKPQSAPKLLSVKVTGRSEVTLNWSKALDPVSYYLVAYGTKSGKLEFGNPNIGDKNTTTYVVKGLNNNQTYYFKIRAGNNCMPGEFSNEIAVKASGDNITSPARGFKAGVLSIQNQKTSLNTELKFKPITSANPQRVLNGSTNLVSKFINFISQIFKKL